MRLADYTTLGLGGPAKSFVAATSEAELVCAIRSADAWGSPVLVLGGGSNLVIADSGFPGTVVHVASKGVRFSPVDDTFAGGPPAASPLADVSTAAASSSPLVDVTVAAGEDWDSVVAAVVAEGLAGLECLSGIPGRAGATPVQNVGAYGQEVAGVITRVRVYDRVDGTLLTLTNELCRFSYRNSLFKVSNGRYVVTEVTFRLYAEPLSRPVKYAELASELGVEMGSRASVGEVRSAVLKIRSRKGMVLNPGDPDTRSAGSFFTNPVLGQDEFARVEAAAGDARVPRFDAGDGLVKVPAAWLIEHAGFAKGYGAPGPARVSSKHTLALVNAGAATTADLLSLAREIVSGVRDVFGVTLTPEPILVGVTL
ncbi:MAG TPA: UDP-N-acetylmuramate dehydrogenase [Trebonia sp.]|jgi:UDP-N-acetylmuramate dehydrogenase|nr:UDP-N-acetylmuramate dehydrogenase [Trebonia sp.]